MTAQVMVAKAFYQSKCELDPGVAQRIDKFIQKMMDDPSSPGIGLERVQSALDPNMWSARVNRDLRAILHHDGERTRIPFRIRRWMPTGWGAFQTRGEHSQ